MTHNRPDLKQELKAERESLLRQINKGLETPMLVLAFVWLALFVVEMVWGLTRILEVAGYVIWGIFAFEVLLGTVLAPRKTDYLKRNWLKVVAVIAPALRIFRLFAVLRLTRLAGMSRGLRLVRLVSSLNRGMRALGRTMRRRGFGYVITLSVIVAFAGAAGMYNLEGEAPGGGFENYGEALWWTFMILVTLGSDYWPLTPAGRILCFFLALYSFGVFGYITATLATFFVGRDAEREDAELASAKSIARLREDIAELREEIQRRER